MDQPSANLASGQPPKKKRLLLIDGNGSKRALRVKIMGEAGLDVDCASDTSAARLLWRNNSYHLVLIDFRHDAQGAAEFCVEIKTDSPRQVVAFLVGKPAYLSSSPNLGVGFRAGCPVGLGARGCHALDERLQHRCGAGGFLEATLRMVAKRSLNDPRPKKTPAQSFGAAVRRAQSKDRVAS